MSLMVFLLLLLLRSTPSLCSAPFAPETFAQPFSFTQTMKKRPPPGNNAAQHTLGTTLLACSFNNFTVIACDSRSSINGEIVANGGASKITVLPTRAAWSMKNSRMKEAGLGKDVVIARCGSTLVTQSLLEKLHRWSWHNTMQYNVCYSAKNIGKLLRHLILSLGGNIQSGFIVCDNSNIFTLEPSGAILHHTKPKSGLGYASLGSGSVHALGYISEHIFIVTIIGFKIHSPAKFNPTTPTIMLSRLTTLSTPNFSPKYATAAKDTAEVPSADQTA